LVVHVSGDHETTSLLIEVVLVVTSHGYRLTLASLIHVAVR
jgi:hypothetical protein